MSSKVRIDKWLWSIRAFKTRKMAKEACQAGKIKINDSRIKPSQIVEIGGIITIQKGYIKYKYKVRGIIEKRVSAKLAKDNYIDLTSDNEKIKQNSKLFTPQYRREKGMGRPTKKERRDMDKLIKNFIK
ncbi:MAG: RNA-binding protein [Candidatus Marinimicrobia bacterium]|nr:RNA-binding protein [Candidatus Neomarinimicrobiota bacterium]|tara:strand:+ start:1434 stop:1820 length:387 start_codon:yes stop_codon:yes gene_type:complete